MTTPDTLAKLIEKIRKGFAIEEDDPDCVKETLIGCNETIRQDADKLQAALDALAEKWEATAKGIPDGYYLEAAFAKALKACAAELRK